eukprot:1788314-Amphidinium_carterae.1
MPLQNKSDYQKGPVKTILGPPALQPVHTPKCPVLVQFSTPPGKQTRTAAPTEQPAERCLRPKDKPSSTARVLMGSLCVLRAERR